MQTAAVGRLQLTLKYTGIFSCASLQFLPSARLMFLMRLLRTSSTQSQESSVPEVDIEAWHDGNNDCLMRCSAGTAPKRRNLTLPQVLASSRAKAAGLMDQESPGLAVQVLLVQHTTRAVSAATNRCFVEISSRRQACRRLVFGRQCATSYAVPRRHLAGFSHWAAKPHYTGCSHFQSMIENGLGDGSCHESHTTCRAI